jgi:hypothetical protein
MGMGAGPDHVIIAEFESELRSFFDIVLQFTSLHTNRKERDNLRPTPSSTTSSRSQRAIQAYLWFKKPNFIYHVVVRKTNPHPGTG